MELNSDNVNLTTKKSKFNDEKSLVLKFTNSELKINGNEVISLYKDCHTKFTFIDEYNFLGVSKKVTQIFQNSATEVLPYSEVQASSK